jgi:hypothetical protein
MQNWPYNSSMPAVAMSLSNKPVLPTATTWLNDDSTGPLRRQTGQPLDSFGRTTNAELRKQTASHKHGWESLG